MQHNFEQEIARLKTEAAERETIRYSDDFKDRAVDVVGELKNDGWTQTRISDELEIPWATLGRWCEDANGSGEDDEPASFRPVEVVDGGLDGDDVTLVSPSGWRIEGLTVAEAVEAARRLG